MDVLKLLPFLMYATAILSLICSIILWVTSEKIRARQLLSIALLIASLFFWGAILRDRNTIPLYGSVLEIRHTLGGAFMAMFFTLSPIEFIMPGWFNRKHLLQYLLPFLSIVLLYIISLLVGVEYRTLFSLSEVKKYGTEFNVWIRFLFFTIALGYALITFLVPYRINHFMKLKKWLMFYSFGSLGIIVVYSGIVLIGNAWSAIFYMSYLLLFSVVITILVMQERHKQQRYHFTKEKPLFKE